MTLSLTLIMGIVVVLLVMKFDLKWIHALLAVLFGLTLGGTQAGEFLLGGLESLSQMIATAKF